MNLPGRARMVAPAGIGVVAAGPAARILPSWITTTALAMSCAARPRSETSTSLAPVMASGGAAIAATGAMAKAQTIDRPAMPIPFPRHASLALPPDERKTGLGGPPAPLYPGSMFNSLIEQLRGAGIAVSITEYLALLGAMKANVAEYSVDDFYYLSRATLVKDERHLDRFDRVFAEVFRGLERAPGDPAQANPEEWLRRISEKTLTPEEMAQIEAMGGFDKLMETLAPAPGGTEGAPPGRQ